jgi:hypothetical protein
MENPISREEKLTLEYYIIDKDRLCIKADGSLGKYTKFQAFFVKMFSYFNKISFDRDKIISRITKLKNEFEKTVNHTLEDFTKLKETDSKTFYDQLRKNQLAYIHMRLDLFFGETKTMESLSSNYDPITIEFGNYINRNVPF